MSTVSPEEIRTLIESIIAYDSDSLRLDLDAPLLGAVREFDSIAVTALLLALEERYGIDINNSELDASTFRSVSSVALFVNECL